MIQRSRIWESQDFAAVVVKLKKSVDDVVLKPRDHPKDGKLLEMKNS